MTTGLDPITRTSGSGSTWVELAVSAYADIATAVSSIGATPATLVIDSPETVSTALVIPDTLFLRIAKGASLTKSGSGTITFAGLGLDNPDHLQTIFFGFDAGDVTWSGSVYPHELSTEWWDTGNISFQDRYNCADLAVDGKEAHIYGYPRTLTSTTAVVGETHHLYLTAGDYPNTSDTYFLASPPWPPFLMRDNSSIIGLPGNRVHESSVDGNGWLIYAWHSRSGGGESNDYQTGLIVDGVNVIGDPTMVETSGSNSCILLGNCHDSAIRRCTFNYTKAYAAVLGLYGITGNHAYRSEIRDCEFIACGTQVAVLLNAKSCRIKDNRFYQQDSSGVSSYTIIDIEPNIDTDVIEDVVIEGNEIDCRDIDDGSKFAGAIAVQAALSGSMKNVTIRNNRIYGRDLFPIAVNNNPLTGGILVTGTTELYMYDNDIRGAVQRAYQVDRCQYVEFFDNTAIQNQSAAGDSAALLVQACFDSNFHNNSFNRSGVAFAQAAGIMEQEFSHPVTTSGTTVTGVFTVGLLRLFFDNTAGKSVTINNADYVIDSWTSQTTIELTTSVGTLTQKTFVDANVTTGTENIAITSHGHNTGSRVYLTTTGVVPAGLTNTTEYFVIRVDANNLKLAATLDDANSNTPVNITAAAGGGTHTLTPMLLTKFSNNEYWGNKTPDGITLSDTGTSIVYNAHDTQLSDYVAPDNSTALTALASQNTNTILGTITPVPVNPVTWSNMVGVSQSGVDNKLTKTAATAAFDAGAFSVQSIPGDGYVEWTTGESGTDKFGGLSYVDTSQHYNTIDYAIQVDTSLNIAVYELGTGISTFGTATANTTKFKIERVGTTVSYYKDTTGVGGYTLMHTSGVSSTGNLHVDCSIYTTGGTFGGVTLGGGFGNVEALTPSQAYGVIEDQIAFPLIGVASDETTALTTGTAKLTFRMPFAFTLTDVRASLSTAQATGSIFTVDINEAGTTILSTKLTIDNTEKTSTTAATPRVISDSALADDAEITVDIDQIGDGTAKGLKVWLIGHR